MGAQPLPCVCPMDHVVEPMNWHGDFAARARRPKPGQQPRRADGPPSEGMPFRTRRWLTQLGAYPHVGLSAATLAATPLPAEFAHLPDELRRALGPLTGDAAAAEQTKMPPVLADFRTVAEASGAALVPFMLAPFATDPDAFLADGIHPKAASQPAMLNVVWATLGPLLAADARPAATASADRDGPY